MDVVIDARMILPQMTGVGRYLLGLAGEFRRLPEGDCFEMWLQSHLPVDHAIWSQADRVLRLRRVSIPHMDIRQQLVLPALLLRRQPDLLHYPHFDLPFGAPGRVVATIHDLKYIARPDFFPQIGRIKRFVMLVMMRFTVWRAQDVIAVSESTRRDILRYLGGAPEKITVIPEGVDPVFFKNIAPESIEATRRNYSLDEPFILFVGERRPHKNLTGLIQAFDIFRRMAAQRYHLVIVGKPYAVYQEPERMAEQLGLGSRVHFLDYLPEADLPGMLRSAEALALLSYYEGFGLPVLEAMAAGLPVVAADATALPEAVGGAGLLVPADDPQQAAVALRQVVHGGARRDECIQRGLARASQFTWERCARETVSLYRKALGKHEPG